MPFCKTKKAIGGGKKILHDFFVQFQSIFNNTNINHGQSYPIFGFWLKFCDYVIYLEMKGTNIILELY